MPRSSSSKKVSRAAQTGGGRTGRGNQSWLFPTAVAMAAVLGIAGVAYSRDQRRAELSSGDANVRPLAGEDHWHTAYGIYICDQFIEPITAQTDPEGIHTHADGVIHVHPFVRRAAGRNAQLGKFFDAVDLDFSDNEIEIPGGETYTEGEDECDGEPGVLQLKVKGEERVRTVDLREFTFSEDRQVITIAFAPEGAEIPLTPSEITLDNLSDVPGASTVPPAATIDESSTTAPAADDTSSTTAPDATTSSSP